MTKNIHKQLTINNMKDLNLIIATACRAGFESYGNFRTEDDNIQNEILTCIHGIYSGEVLEIRYKYTTGEVVGTIQYCQFPEGHPHHTEPKFVISK